MEKKPQMKKKLPEEVEESNSIGADAGDATSGTPVTPEEWAREQPLEDGPTYPMDAGDPSPLQPAAGSPLKKRAGSGSGKDESREKPE